MLSKNNKILIGCLALLLVMSVGYALFSDTITINGTATAKGDFDISGSCQAGLPTELVSYVSSRMGGGEEKGYKNDSCSFVGNEGSFNVEFEYPGAMRYFTVKMTNTGTIDAVLGTPEITDYNLCFDNDFSGEIGGDECYTSLPVPGHWVSAAMMFDGFDVVGVQVGNGEIVPYNRITQELASDFLDEDGNYFLKPGNSAFMVFKMELNQDYSNNYNKLLMTASETFAFPFTQVQ